MIEDMCHRNMAFTLFHAYHLPQVRIDSVSIVPLGGGLRRVDVVVKNLHAIPTRSAQDVANHITRPDIISLAGSGIKVLAGFVVENPLLDVAREQKHQPDRIRVETIPGMGTVKLRWIVQGNGEISVTAESVKGGRDVVRTQ